MCVTIEKTKEQKQQQQQNAHDCQIVAFMNKTDSTAHKFNEILTNCHSNWFSPVEFHFHIKIAR